MNRKQEGILHVSLLIVLQWISVAVVITNSIGIHMSFDAHMGFVSSDAGAQDLLYTVLGIMSFTAATLPLCLQLYHHCRTNESGLLPTRITLLSEISLSIVMMVLWAAVCSVIITHTRVSSPCSIEKTSPCRLLDLTIVLGLVTLAVWILLLLVASFSMSRLPSLPAFVLEPNPYHTLDYRHSTLMASHTTESLPLYTPRSSLLQPPPSLMSKHSSYASDIEYPRDIKHAVIYRDDSLPIITVGGSKLDLSFL
ncbi:hypothetical protein BC940DRAFT_322281 [Gongronella butleri]|nr:hypothetical protein BC940DRAFT_322281 [Gongronella butleri]